MKAMHVVEHQVENAGLAGHKVIGVVGDVVGKGAKILPTRPPSFPFKSPVSTIKGRPMLPGPPANGPDTGTEIP